MNALFPVVRRELINALATPRRSVNPEHLPDSLISQNK